MADINRLKITRRTALCLIIVLQTTHFILQMLDPKSFCLKTPAFILIIAKIMELRFSIGCAYTIVERNLGVKWQSYVIQGVRIDVLLWLAAAWSAGLVGNDLAGNAAGFVSTLQLFGIDVVMGMWTFGRLLFWTEKRVCWVEASEERGEKRHEVVDVRVSAEGMNQKKEKEKEEV